MSAILLSASEILKCALKNKLNAILLRKTYVLFTSHVYWFRTIDYYTHERHEKLLNRGNLKQTIES